ncbi:hypothetical protein D3C87_1364690 [compost metagenome]
MRRAHVVEHALDHGDVRLFGDDVDDVDGVAPGRHGLVAGGIALHEREGVRAGGQRGVDLEGPLAVFADGGLAQFAGAGGIPDHHGDRVAGHAGAVAAEQRMRVVGGGTGGHVAGDAAHVVGDARDGQSAGVGRGHVDLEIERGRRRALVAGAVARDDGDGVQAFEQVGRGREGPGAVFGDFGGADLGAVVTDDDGVTGRALAAEFGLAVVGDAAGGDAAQDVAGVVGGAAHRRRKGREGRCACAHCGGDGRVGGDVRLFECHEIPML